MSARDIVLKRFDREGLFQLGPIGHLSIFLWSLSMVMLVPVARLVWAAGLCLVVAAMLYLRSFRRILRLRFLAMLILLALPPLFLLGDMDRAFLGVAYSAMGAWAALQIALRFVVILTAVDGFTHSVDITQIAGFLERLGLRGLGFSLGVALNLLPGLQRSSIHAWHSLRMRGGLRQKKWRGLQLLVMTIVTNALRRAEEITLAAEARAFSPDCCRPAPLKMSFLDRLLLPVGVVLTLIIVLLP
jgi:energy-coupling factor transporter transmembrane protein EcfT